MKVNKFILMQQILLLLGCSINPDIIDNEKNAKDDVGISELNIIESHAGFDNSLSPMVVDKDFLPSSIIFVIADGTGIGHYTLAYYSNDKFPFKNFNHLGLVATHPDDCATNGCDSGFKKVTDSASSATAYSTGSKTFNGAIGVDKNNQPLETIVEIAEKHGMHTGLIATSTITHATPASFASHVNNRKKEFEIAEQLSKSNVDLLFGGGRFYWPDSVIENFINRDGVLISSINSTFNEESRVLGLFADKALAKNSEGRNPTTTQMAQRALEYFEKKNNNFFLMIEESQVDWGGHRNDGDYIKGEMDSLIDLIEFLIEYQKNHPNILVVLTSDHECGGVAVHDYDDGSLHINFTSTYHTANFVPIWASGPGSKYFDNFLDNTDVGNLLMDFIILNNE